MHHGVGAGGWKKNPNSFTCAVKLQVWFFLYPNYMACVKLSMSPPVLVKFRRCLDDKTPFIIVAVHVRRRGYKFVGDLT